MSIDEKPDKTASSAPSKQTVILLIGTLADTTWRLFVPTLAGCVGGIYLDHKLDSTPWLTIAGVVGGTLLAGLLVYQQLKNINKV